MVSHGCWASICNMCFISKKCKNDTSKMLINIIRSNASRLKSKLDFINGISNQRDLEEIGIHSPSINKKIYSLLA